MNIKVKDKVIAVVAGTVLTVGTVVSTHTYKETGLQIAAVKDGTGSSVWVDVTFLKKVS